MLLQLKQEKYSYFCWDTPVPAKISTLQRPVFLLGHPGSKSQSTIFLPGWPFLAKITVYHTLNLEISANCKMGHPGKNNHFSVLPKKYMFIFISYFKYLELAQSENDV